MENDCFGIWPIEAFELVIPFAKNRFGMCASILCDSKFLLDHRVYTIRSDSVNPYYE